MTLNSDGMKTSILSFVLGDVLGLAIQFITRQSLEKKLQNNSILEIIKNSNSNIPLGTWSDDTSLTLCTMASIVETKTINLKNISEKFCQWFQFGYMTPYGKAFDIGRTTFQTIVSAIENNRPILIGADRKDNNGNGSLMRILPVTMYCYAKKMNKSEIFETVKNISSLTHAHPISIIGCYIYTMVIFMILDGGDKEFILSSLKELKNHFPKEYEPFLAEYDDIFSGKFVNKKAEEINAYGYVKDTLEAALWGFFNSHFIEDCILKILSLSGDTDTNGAVGGGLCGLYYGLRGLHIGSNIIEQNDLSDLIVKKDDIIELSDKFFEIIKSF